MAVAAAKSDRSAMFDLNGLKTAVSSATARVMESAESVAKSESGSKALTSLKSAVSTVTAKVKETAEAAAEQGKELMKSKQQKDAEAVDRLASGFGDNPTQPASASDHACARFNAALGSTIDVKFAEIMNGKVDADKFLTFVDSQILTATGVSPFKLINHKGIWYLAARDGNKLKSFSFAKIENLRLLESHFPVDSNIDKQLAEEDGIWLNDDKKEIVLKVDQEVAGYFKRRKLIANQVIEKELEDGGLIISAKVGHQNQVVPIVRYWIPHIRIISPDGMQAEMEAEISAYLKASR